VPTIRTLAATALVLICGAIDLYGLTSCSTNAPIGDVSGGASSGLILAGVALGGVETGGVASLIAGVIAVGVAGLSFAKHTAATVPTGSISEAPSASRLCPDGVNRNSVIHMTLRTTSVVLIVGAMLASIAGVIVAFQMVIIANANQNVPDILPTLIVDFLVLTTLLLGVATAIRKKLARCDS
jgi:hypothetical protein